MIVVELGDWPRLDGMLARALELWRRRSAELATLSRPLDVTADSHARDLASSPFPEDLVHEEVLHALRERREDPLAAALLPWAESLWLEGMVYPMRVEASVAWGMLRELRGRSERISARGLRAEMLAGAHPTIRGRAAEDLLLVASDVAEAAFRLIERRLECEARVGQDCRWLATPDVEPRRDASGSIAVRLATKLLDATEEHAAEQRRDTWEDTLRASMVTESRQGWPVRPTARWLRSVLAGDEWLRGLRLTAPRVPSVVGAMSYARALGSLGMRILEAARRASIPLAMHQHPLGHRRHARRALFASIVGETAFASRVLGLSRPAARDHRRVFAGGLVASLRIDAVRVLTADALRSGTSHAREAFREWSHRVLGRDVPPVLLGVVPTLRPGDGAALTGALLASSQRRAAIDRHDEDWFRNPRAQAELRAEDEAPRTDVRVSEEFLETALEELTASLGDALG